MSHPNRAGQTPSPTIHRLQFPAFCFNNICNTRHETVKRGCSQVFVGAQTHRDGLSLLLFVTDYEHVGNFLKLCCAYFRVHALWRVVQLYTDTLVTKALHNLLSIRNMPISYRDDTYLHRSQPGRKCACRMFDENADEPFECSKNGTVNDSRRFRLTIFIYIGAIKTAR